jgi:uncharacterized protein
LKTNPHIPSDFIVLRQCFGFGVKNFVLFHAPALIENPGHRSDMELQTVRIDKPADTNFILGQSHFIKTVEDIYEVIVSTNPGIRFGLAFCESSGPALVRHAGNDQKLIDLATVNASAVGCGHSFLLFLEGGFPVNILNAIKNVPEVCSIFCATANPVEVIVAVSGKGRGVLGIIDGVKPTGIETDKDIAARKDFLRKIGYKL